MLSVGRRLLQRVLLDLDHSGTAESRTSQGTVLDTDTLTPLLDNAVVLEAIKLWKEVAGPPKDTDITATEALQLWFTGRCAMMICSSIAFTALQTPVYGTIGTAMMPGSRRVWSRDLEDVIACDKLTCRHGTEFPDVLVANHAPGGQSLHDGAVNRQVGASEQLAAYTFFSWLTNDDNILEAIVKPLSWPNHFSGTFVRPTSCVPSVRVSSSWRDPGLSMHCATYAANLEHPSVAIALRLPNALEEVTDRGDRSELILTFQKSQKNIFDAESTQKALRRSEVLPTWAIWLSACSVVRCLWLSSSSCFG